MALRTLEANRRWLVILNMQMHLAPLTSADWDSWIELAQGYKAFYQTPTNAEEYLTAWRRITNQEGIFGLGAKLDGDLVGFAHYFFHTNVWSPKVCYLQDLFTAPQARGKGVARALIEEVAQMAVTQGATRFYWLTQDHNLAARGLYDKIAKHNGFIRYDFPLSKYERP